MNVSFIGVAGMVVGRFGVHLLPVITVARRGQLDGNRAWLERDAQSVNYIVGSLLNSAIDNELIEQFNRKSISRCLKKFPVECRIGKFISIRYMIYRKYALKKTNLGSNTLHP